MERNLFRTHDSNTGTHFKPSAPIDFMRPVHQESKPEKPTHKYKATGSESKIVELGEQLEKNEREVRAKKREVRDFEKNDPTTPGDKRKHERDHDYTREQEASKFYTQLENLRKEYNDLVDERKEIDNNIIKEKTERGRFKKNTTAQKHRAEELARKAASYNAENGFETDSD